MSHVGSWVVSQMQLDSQVLLVSPFFCWFIEVSCLYNVVRPHPVFWQQRTPFTIHLDFPSIQLSSASSSSVSSSSSRNRRQESSLQKPKNLCLMMPQFAKNHLMAKLVFTRLMLFAWKFGSLQLHRYSDTKNRVMWTQPLAYGSSFNYWLAVDLPL